MRNVNTGGLEVYDINNNQLTGAAFIGTGLERQFAGIAAANGVGTSDLVLRNVNTGAFEVYDIANNQPTGAAPLGAVGLNWQLGGFAADPPTASTPSMGDSNQVAQLVQAMAGFGGGSGGAAENLNAAPLSADTTQQTLLTQAPSRQSCQSSSRPSSNSRSISRPPKRSGSPCRTGCSASPRIDPVCESPRAVMSR